MPFGKMKKCLISQILRKKQPENKNTARRYCAKQAMNVIGVDCNEIQSSSHGFPIWPKGIVGSISHSKGTCLSAVAKLKTLKP